LPTAQGLTQDARIRASRLPQMPRRREHSRGSSASPESLSRDVEQPVYVCKDCRGTNYPPTVFRSKCHRVFPVEWWGSHSSGTRHSQQGLLGGRYFPSPSAATTLGQRRGEKGGNLREYIVPSSNPPKFSHPVPSRSTSSSAGLLGVQFSPESHR
jgi:hypothetical protein